MQKKKRRPKYFRIFVSLALFFLVLYYLGTWVYGFFTGEASTYTVDVGTLRVEEKTSALMVRNEMLVNTALKGKLTYFPAEGETVEKGQTLAEVFNDGAEIREEEASEKELLKKQAEFDYNLLGYEIEETKKDIARALDNGAYTEIPALKNDLVTKLDRLEKLKGDNRYLANRSDTYSEQTVGSGILSEGQKKAIVAPADGIVSYTSDGLESFLTIDNIYNIKFSELKKQPVENQSLRGEYATGKKPILRIVDKATYYLVGMLPNESVENYKKGTTLSVDIGVLKAEGDVVDVYVEDDYAIVIVRMKETFDGFHTKRWLDASLIKEDFKGLKIPVDTVVNEEGALHVFVVDADGKLKKVPVKILGYDDEFAVVYNEQFYDAASGVVRSIKIGQKIVRNAHMYKEGERLE